MHLASDYIHPFKDAGSRTAQCRVRIYLPDDVRDTPVVICSEVPNNPGGSITNSAEVIAAGVIRTNKLPTPLVWIEHWSEESTGGGPETFELAGGGPSPSAGRSTPFRWSLQWLWTTRGFGSGYPMQRSS